VFDTSMSVQAVRRLAMENDLRAAIERSDFVLRYHPVVELATGRAVGVEALMRWQHPEHGLVHPAEFMPVADETGLLVPIGRWVIEEACRQTRLWHDQYPEHPPMLWVNLSSVQLQHPGLVNQVEEALEKTGLPARSLYLEITENSLMDAARAQVENVRGLSELGVHIAIDNFGAGYTSLSTIRQVPVDMLKVDQTLVQGLGSYTTNTAIVRAVVTLARDIGIAVIAEGIETAQQREILQEMDCPLGQGYLFSHPLIDEEAGRLFDGQSLY